MAADRDTTSSPPGAFTRDLARTLGVAGFWRWWIGELASLVPAGPRAAWQRRRVRPVLAFDGARATLWRPVVADSRVAMTEHAAIPVDGGPDEVAASGRAAIAALARANGEGTVAVTLALPPRTVLRKHLVLPLAVEENLRQVVGYDLDRHTPFKAEELYYDAAVVERDLARNVVHVDLATARRNAVDPLIARAEGWGASVVAVSADGPERAATSTLNLMPPERRPARGPWRRWQFWVPVGALALTALVATVLPVWQKREYVIDLGAVTDRARAQAAVSEALRSEVDRQVGDYNFALERKFGYPPAVQVLDDVTRIMPDDTWLTQLELRTLRGKDNTRELSLRGESANAGRLVTVLEDSKLFTQAAPRSPTTKIQPGPGEIFDIGAQLKPLPGPPTAPLVIAAGDVPPATTSRTPATPPTSGAQPPAGQAPGALPPAATNLPPAGAAPAVAPPPPASAAASNAPPTATPSPGTPLPPSAPASTARPTPATPPGAGTPPPSPPSMPVPRVPGSLPVPATVPAPAPATVPPPGGNPSPPVGGVAPNPPVGGGATAPGPSSARHTRESSS